MIRNLIIQTVYLSNLNRAFDKKVMTRSFYNCGIHLVEEPTNGLRKAILEARMENIVFYIFEGV